MTKRPVRIDPLQSAREAGLRYVSDRGPGIRRRKAGGSFTYVQPDGSPVSRADRARIKALAIPPAWTDVWICPLEKGHIQATGRDAKGRKQYRYHERWHEVRDENKYGRMVAFGQVLPLIRARCEKDLALPNLPCEKVLATIVRLLEGTLVRVGNEEYARENKSFGLTTMRTRHVEVEGATVRFQFRGKSGKEHNVDMTDRRVARVVRRCEELPGQELFQYLDENGERRSVDSQDVNEYIKAASGDDFTAKDFRTWAGTVLAARALQEMEAFGSEAQARRNVVQAIEHVSQRLGNTKAVCRKCYVHPAVIDAYMDGSMLHTLRRRADEEIRESPGDLPAEEAAVLALLRARLAREDGHAG